MQISVALSQQNSSFAPHRSCVEASHAILHVLSSQTSPVSQQIPLQRTFCPQSTRHSPSSHTCPLLQQLTDIDASLLQRVCSSLHGNIHPYVSSQYSPGKQQTPWQSGTPSPHDGPHVLNAASQSSPALQHSPPHIVEQSRHCRSIHLSFSPHDGMQSSVKS